MTEIRSTLIFFIKSHPEILLDEEDLGNWGIYPARFSGNGYIYLLIGKKSVPLHRAVLNFPDLEVDHINRNKLDNRKENLRTVSRHQNAANGSSHADSRCSYKGVHIIKDKYWIARITQNGKQLHLGSYKTAEAAAKAYDRKAKELFGEFAGLNFPETEEAQ